MSDSYHCSQQLEKMCAITSDQGGHDLSLVEVQGVGLRVWMGIEGNGRGRGGSSTHEVEHDS